MARERIFRFKQFAVSHRRSAMKVGVDGTLLGAWADCSRAATILDAGTGCGLIALMLAQRFPSAQISAVEIDSDACEEAEENFTVSPWRDRLSIINADLTTSEGFGRFDHIVSNPPFFTSGVDKADTARIVARHCLGFSPTWLLKNCRKLLTPDGALSMIFPADSLDSLIEIANSTDMHLRRITKVKGHADAPVKRVLAEFACNSCEIAETELLILENSPGKPTEAYRSLCSEFYLRF